MKNAIYLLAITVPVWNFNLLALHHWKFIFHNSKQWEMWEALKAFWFTFRWLFLIINFLLIKRKRNKKESKQQNTVNQKRIHHFFAEPQLHLLFRWSCRRKHEEKLGRKFMKSSLFRFYVLWIVKYCDAEEKYSRNAFSINIFSRSPAINFKFFLQNFQASHSGNKLREKYFSSHIV